MAVQKRCFWSNVKGVWLVGVRGFQHANLSKSTGFWSTKIHILLNRWLACIVNLQLGNEPACTRSAQFYLNGLFTYANVRSAGKWKGNAVPSTTGERTPNIISNDFLHFGQVHRFGFHFRFFMLNVLCKCEAGASLIYYRRSSD